MRSDYSGIKFLIVDDESDIRDFLRWEFEDRGGKVFDAEDMESGLQTFKKVKPDFSLLDIRMPNGTGVELLTRCKQVYPELSIALMTGFTEISTIQIYAAGACDIFMKPIQYKLLFPRVDRELLPLEEKFIITGERYIHAEIVVKRNFEECQKT
ncbi:MAG: response regulator, partial [Bdellovibrionales bacterium]|nr:response regulator [Bdellovibrionales bacterium]